MLNAKARRRKEEGRCAAGIWGFHHETREKHEKGGRRGSNTWPRASNREKRFMLNAKPAEIAEGALSFQLFAERRPYKNMEVTTMSITPCCRAKRERRTPNAER